jgi:hypothetical protein
MRFRQILAASSSEMCVRFVCVQADVRFGFPGILIEFFMRLYAQVQG